MCCVLIQRNDRLCIELFYQKSICLNTVDFLTKFIPLCRGGRGGGYKELDEEELEEVKKRRKEAEVGCLLGIHFLFYFS
jgi:hypothetical protein